MKPAVIIVLPDGLRFDGTLYLFTAIYRDVNGNLRVEKCRLWPRSDGYVTLQFGYRGSHYLHEPVFASQAEALAWIAR